MSDEFLTQGFQDDRYLKAIRLIDQFEREVEAALRDVGQRMIDAHPDLFEEGVDGRENTGRNSSSALAYTRVDYPMARVQDPESNQSLKLNVHLYWRDPATCNRTDIDGAVHGFGYKIKNATREDIERVVAETRDWPVETTDDPFGSTTLFYKHVESKSDLEEAADTLVDHFEEFGHEFGVDPDV